MLIRLYTLEREHDAVQGNARDGFFLASYRNDIVTVPDRDVTDLSELVPELVRDYVNWKTQYVLFTCSTQPAAGYALPSPYCRLPRQRHACRLWQTGQVKEFTCLRVTDTTTD